MKTNQRLMKLLSLIPGLFAMAVVFGLLGSALVIFQSLEMSKAVDGVFLQKQTLAAVLPILRVILLVILIRVLFTILNNWLVNLVAIRIKGNLREQLIQKIDRLGPVYLRQSKSGELVTAAIQGIESIDAYFSQYIPQIIIAAAMPLTILAVIFPIDWLSGLVFLITAPLIPFFMALVGRSSEVQTKKQFLALSRMGADFLDTLQGLTTLKTLGRSRQYATHVEQVSERYREATIQVLRITFLSAFVLELLATISTAVVAVEIGLRLLYGRILFEQAFFILLIAPEFYLPMRNLGMRYHAGMTGVSAAARIFEVMDLPEPKSENASMRTETTPDLKTPFTLKLRNVSFTYPGRESMALKNVDLEFASGKQYVLVGHSGAGKSTVMQLLMRFLQPTQGTITMDGLDIQRIDLQDWRSQIAWVPQRPMLFDTSLLENIRLNRREISQEAVWQALDFARLKEFTKHLPEGLHTPLREWGSRLSGGQAQRVALARAFVKEAPLLLMDEPTSFLDPVLEMELEQASALLLKGRTSITIAHRYSTAVSADEVIVLEKGRVVQIGNHQSLITQEGPYSRLFSASESGQ